MSMKKTLLTTSILISLAGIALSFFQNDLLFATAFIQNLITNILILFEEHQSQACGD